jgi:hypothetical protein
MNLPFANRGLASVSRPLVLPRETVPFQNDGVLRGLVGRGHGLEALSIFLRLDRQEVLELVVSLDLPNPHNRPMRATRGPKAWVASDYFHFIQCWTAGWHAASIGDRFGRSAGAIWSKARWLGLRRRDRKSLFRPPPITAPGQTGELTEPDTRVEEKPCRFAVTATGERLSIRQKVNRNEIFWTSELDAELANRYWANQHYEAIAKEWGVTARTIASRAYRIELPKRERAKLVEHYDPSVITANIAAANYVHRKCLVVPGWFFWAHRNGKKTSKRGKKIQDRQSGSSLGDSYSVGCDTYAFGL